jgi:transcription antitermination protein NusB
MANRHLARSTVLQALYEWDFGGFKKDVKDILPHVAEEFAPGMSDRSFAESLALGVAGKRQDLDSIIEKAAPEWPIENINLVDRNILRIGLYELLFASREQVPPKVAINEAIELAKKFGGDTSFKFVNGVLGAVYREMGEPGKDDTGKSSGPVPLEALLGAVVYAKKDGEVYLCLVHDVFGHWTLSKGHIDTTKKIEDELGRTIEEEIGLKVKMQEHLGHTEYGTFDPEKGKIKKRVEYYMAEAEFVDVTLKKTGGLDDAKWFKMKDILDLNFYDDILPIVTKAINLLV